MNIKKKRGNFMFNNSNGFVMPVAPTGYSNGNGGFGGFGDDWLALIVILALFGGYGNGGFGFGGFGGVSRDCGCNPCATQADVRAAVDQQTLISKLDQQTYGLADSTYALNNGITTGFAGVQQTLCQGFNGVNTAILQSANGTERGFANLSSQLASCCCETGRAIERGFADTNYNMATQACDTRNLIQNTTRDIIDNANANNRAILDFLVNDKIASLQAENQNLKLKASQAEQNNFIAANQQAQTAELIRRLGADCPIPAYVVPNPNCCYNPQVTFGYNNGCGCA